MLYEGVYSEDFQGHYLMVVLGMFIGYAFIALCEAKLDDKEYSLGELSGANAKRAMLVLLIMTMHSFAEGLGVGVSWAGSNGDVKGQFVTAAIGVHNIPEGMTVALMMMPVSKSRTHCSHVWQTSLHPRAICAPVLDSNRVHSFDHRCLRMCCASRVRCSMVGSVLGDLLKPATASPGCTGIPVCRNVSTTPAVGHRRCSGLDDLHGE